ncbi:MAG: MgtC/SapB family protein [Verrucomicrobia bacterium]|nr:MgtC/SapB family protein [Verrucomicrobiota bacterium]
MDSPLLNFGIALGLGLLVGLQRERAASLMAGIRTFPLVTLFGAICGDLATPHGGWVLSAGIGATAVLLWAANVPRSGPPADDPGLTTEAALLVMFGVGALAGTGDRTLAVVIGATTAVLLHLRPELHAFAARIADSEMRAVMQFAVVALIVLPLLPEGRWGPYGVINPRQIWWMVVLITGISLASYLAYRLLGDRGGALAAGFLGGLISSTATTVATARGSRAAANGGGSTALPLLVIQIASTVVFGRVLLLVAAAAPDQFVPIVRLPAIMLGMMTLAAVILGWRTRRHPVAPPPASNPAELRLALTFAALFVGVLLAVAAARERLGDAGLYAVAVLSGLTDMDAITLSTAQLARRGELDGAMAGRVILVAAMANLVFKAGAVAVLGSRDLARHVGLLFGGALLVGATLLAVG